MDKVTSGDRVKIERGPFTDFVCNVDKIADNQRAWVLIDILHNKRELKSLLTICQGLANSYLLTPSHFHSVT